MKYSNFSHISSKRTKTLRLFESEEPSDYERVTQIFQRLGIKYEENWSKGIFEMRLVHRDIDVNIDGGGMATLMWDNWMDNRNENIPVSKLEDALKCAQRVEEKFDIFEHMLKWFGIEMSTEMVYILEDETRWFFSTPGKIKRERTFGITAGINRFQFEIGAKDEEEPASYASVSYFSVSKFLRPFCNNDRLITYLESQNDKEFTQASIKEVEAKFPALKGSKFGF